MKCAGWQSLPSPTCFGVAGLQWKEKGIFCNFGDLSSWGVGEGTPDYQIGSGFEPCLWSFGRSRRPFQTDQNRRDDRRWKMLPLEKTLDTSKNVKRCAIGCKRCNLGCKVFIFLLTAYLPGLCKRWSWFCWLLRASGQGWRISHRRGLPMACDLQPKNQKTSSVTVRRRTAVKHVWQTSLCAIAWKA